MIGTKRVLHWFVGVAGALLLVLVGARMASVQAQSACNAVITGFDQAMRQCSELNLNWACYGQTNARAAPDDLRFHRPRDRQPITVFDEINVVEQGVVLLHLQDEDQNAPIQAAVYGSATLTTGATLTSFFLIADSPTPLCSATPPGMVVRTETGERGIITVNNVEIELASVAFITTLTPDRMVIVNVEGVVTATIGGVPVSIPVGQQVQVTGVSTGQPILAAGPEASTFAASEAVGWLGEDPGGLTSMQDANTQSVPDVPACGGAIAFGETVTQANAVPGQECIYTFCATQGEPLTVFMDAQSDEVNAWLDVRDPDGNLLYANNDMAASNPDSLICNVGAPVTSCGYTVVARTLNNESAGPFTLHLDQQTDCMQPVESCTVITPFGLNLREGPGLNYPRIRPLPADTQLATLPDSQDPSWKQVQVVDASGQQGWVNTNAAFLTCETIDGSPPTFQPTAVTPTPTPTSGGNGPSRECDKCGPFGTP